MADVAVRASASSSVPRDYTIPGAQELLPKSVSADMDGSAAASQWFPCLQVLDPGGNVMFSALLPSVAAGGSANVSWFPGAELEEGVQESTTGVILDQFLVDSKTSGETSGSVVLTSGTSYVVTAQGTWSYWNAALEQGSPNADAMFPSSLVGRASTQVGLDPECAFAYHDTGSGFTVGHKTGWKFDTGSGLTYVTAQGGPYSTPQPNYLYRYTLVGGGAVLKANVSDTVLYTDNYGKVQVTVYSNSGSGSGGGGGSLLPPDGSDYSTVQVVAGVPLWSAAIDGGAA